MASDLTKIPFRSFRSSCRSVTPSSFRFGCMASWAIGHAPWWTITRSRLRHDLWTSYSRAWAFPKTYFSSPVLSEEPPSSRALKEYPYPSSPVDNSLFEEDTIDYSIPPVSFATAPGPGQLGWRPCHVLRNLVWHRNFADAERVYMELQQTGTPIEPDVTYDILAHYIVRTPDYPNRLEAFARWWSLTPNRTSQEPPRSVYRMRDAILREPTTSDGNQDFSLFIPFTFISAEKGYAPWVAHPVVGMMTRYGDPKVTTPFLRQLIKAIRDHDRETGGISSKTLRTLKMCYDNAITSSVAAGRGEEAYSLLETATKQKIGVSVVSIWALGDFFAMAGDTGRLELVSTIGQRLHPESIRARSFVSVTQARVASFVPRQLYTDVVVSGVPWDRPALVAAIRQTKHALTSSTPTSITHIARTIEVLVDLNRFRLLSFLRRRAYEHSTGAYARWILAQMLLHRNQGDLDYLVNTFRQACHIVGVPKVTQEIIAKSSRYSGRQLPRALSHYPTRWHKLSPRQAHTSLIWEVAVRRAADDAELKSLYDELCHSVARQKGIPTWNGRDVPAAGLFSFEAPPSLQFDAAHFMPFIFRYTTRQGAPAAKAICDDMERLGVPLSQPVVTFYAGALAKAGDAPAVWRLLDALEIGEPAAGAVVEDAPTGRAEIADQLWSGISASLTPDDDLRPNLVTYTTIIRGLVDAGRIWEAQQTASRMMDKIGYVKGSNFHTENVLQMLADRQERAAWSQVCLESRCHKNPANLSALYSVAERHFTFFSQQRSRKL